MLTQAACFSFTKPLLKKTRMNNKHASEQRDYIITMIYMPIKIIIKDKE